MIRLDYPQRSPEWFQARAGLLCASDAADAFATKQSAGEPAKVRDLRLRLAVEQISGRSEEGNPFLDTVRDIRRGLDHEATAARPAYEAKTGDLVEVVGFCRHDTLAIGCSPDGFVGDEGMIEAKCPRAANHLTWMRAGKLPPEHQIQCLHQLLVTGRAWVDFVSYCRGLPEPIPACWVVRYEPTADAVSEYQAAVERFLATVERERAALLGWNVLAGGKT